MESYLTPKQKQILEWIEQYLGEHQTMPSRREIASGLGLSSPATIQQHIEALEKKGFLKRGETRESRALQWTSRSKKLFTAIQNHTNNHSVPRQPELPTIGMSARQSETRSSQAIPLLGSIAAGYPIEVYTDTKMVNVPLELFVSGKQATAEAKDFYVLTVKGESMIDEGIFPNDWVILKKTNTAKPGTTVAALVNGEATLKKFYKTKTGVELHPANSKFSVIHVNPEDRFEIQGTLVGVIRKFT